MEFLYEGHLGGFVVGGDYRTWTPDVWQYLLKRFSPKSVLDVGCGQGFSTKWFQDAGIDAVGVDGSIYAYLHTQVPGHHIVHDFQSGPLSLGRKYDMIWSCEFLEHVDAEYLPNVMDLFANAPIVVCTAAVPGQGGHHHVNCQPESYWIDKFGEYGFTLHASMTDLTRQLAGDTFYASTGMVFTKAEIMIADAERIPGWMTRGQLEWLHSTASGMPTGSVWVEVGSWAGRSLKAVSDALPRGCTLYSVDMFEGCLGRTVQDHIQAKKMLLNLISAITEEGRINIHFLDMSSVDAARMLEDATCDVVFIDAKHDTPSVKSDIDAWLPKMKTGGLLCGHDGEYPSVIEAVRAKLGEHEMDRCIWMKRLA